MKVCIYGAGAIGGHLAARLISAGGSEVSIVARGAQLAAIRSRGITLRSGGATFGGIPGAATDDPAGLPPQDLVFVTLKAPSAPAIARPLAKLLAPRGTAVFIMNGIPWWWHHGLPGNGSALPLLDPEGALWNHLGPQRVLGVVVSSSNAVREPGVVTHTGGNRWAVGEPDGSASQRARIVVDLLMAAGLHAFVAQDIRREIWQKLCINVSANPLAALTRLTSSGAQPVPGLGDLAQSLIEETLAIAAALGWDLHRDVDARAIAQPAGGRSSAKPSMLQDVEAGRALEVDAILGQLQAFGRDARVPTPKIDVVLPLLRGLDAFLRAGSP